MWNRIVLFVGSACVALATGCGNEVLIPLGPDETERPGEYVEVPAGDLPDRKLSSVGPISSARPSKEGLDLRPYTLPPLQSDVPHYELTMAESTLAQFHSNLWTPEQPATFTAEGQSWPVQVRLRGASARFFDKKSWRIELPEDVTLDGQNKLNLVGMYQDSTMMMEKLGLDLLAAMGVPAPRAKYVRLTINGRYEGVFLQVQRVDKRFVKEHASVFFDRDPDIYRCGTHDCEMKLFRQPYQGKWEKQTNESEPSDDLQTLLRAINHTPEPALVDTLEKTMDLDAYLTSMTLDALISNFTVEDSGSYLIHDRSRGLWTYVPWDLNNANSRWWPTYPLGSRPGVDHPLFIFSAIDDWVARRHATRNGSAEFPDYLPAFSNLTTRVAMNPELRQRALDRLKRALDELFREEVLHPRIDQMHALIAPYMADDPYIDNAQFTEGLRYSRDYVTGRIDFLRAEIVRLKDAKRTWVVEAFDPREGWIELANRSETSLSTSRLVVTTNLRQAMQRNVPHRSVSPGETVRFTAAELGLSFESNGEVGLYDGESVTGVFDLLFYGELPPGRHYARNAGAPSGWEIR